MSSLWKQNDVNNYDGFVLKNLANRYNKVLKIRSFFIRKSYIRNYLERESTKVHITQKQEKKD
jgi:hypothetical protein